MGCLGLTIKLYNIINDNFNTPEECCVGCLASVDFDMMVCCYSCVVVVVDGCCFLDKMMVLGIQNDFAGALEMVVEVDFGYRTFDWIVADSRNLVDVGDVVAVVMVVESVVVVEFVGGTGYRFVDYSDCCLGCTLENPFFYIILKL